VLEYLSEWSLSDIGSWASIIGVAISIVLATALFSIKKKFLFRSRVEEHAVKLAKIASSVSSCLNSYSDDDHDIYEAFALANVELRCIQKGASGSLLDDVKSARNGIRFYQLRVFFRINRVAPTEKTVRHVNTKINIVVEELKNVKKELMVGK
jgi:hypothetical protein